MPSSLDPLLDVILQMSDDTSAQVAGIVGELEVDTTSIVHGPVRHRISHGVLQPAVMCP